MYFQTQLRQSYLEVQRNDSGNWVVDKTDAYWETRYVVNVLYQNLNDVDLPV